MSSRVTVGLWVHQLADIERRTGVGRYVVETTRTLATRTLSDIQFEIRSGRPPRDGVEPVLGLPVAHAWPPRRLLHLSWLLANWPPIESVAPTVELVHVLFPSFPMPTKLPLVLTINDLFVIDHPEWYGRGEATAVAATTRRLAARADRVVCLSSHVAEQVVRRLDVDADQVVVAPPGVRRPPSPPHGPRQDLHRPYVMALGAVTPRKNLQLVLHAMAMLRGVDLVVVGQLGSSARSTLDMVEALRLTDRVHLLGALSDDRMQAVLGGACALVHPSLDEGFGFPPLEAMAAGIPALVARSGSLPEVVDSAGVVLPPDDPHSWADAVRQVLDDPVHREGLVARGTARADHLTWERAADRLIDVYRNVLSAR